MIERLKIKNFRSIKDADVPLSRFNVLVGVNGAGKSNFVGALHFIRRLALGSSTDLISAEFVLSPTELMYDSNLSENICFSVILKATSKTRYEFNVNMSVRETEDNSGIFKVIIQQESLYKLDAANAKSVTIYEREGNVLKNPNEKQIPLQLEYDTLALSEYRTAEVLDARNILARLRIPGSTYLESRETISDQKSTSLAGLLFTLQKDDSAFALFKEAAKDLVPGISEFEATPASISEEQMTQTPLLKSFLLLTQQKNIRAKLSLQSVSSGDIRTLYIIAAALVLKEGSSLIIEEVENGLHPKRAKLLVDYLDTVSRSQNKQIIFTTHSPTVINFVKATDIIFIYKDSSGTKFRPLREPSMQTEVESILNEGGQMTEFISSKFGV